MAESLNEQFNDDNPTEAAESAAGFWDTENDAKTEDTQDSTGNTEEYEEGYDNEGAVPEWLSLSRAVDNYDTRGETSAPRQRLASQYPKTQGGRVVVRGPVASWAIPDEPDMDEDLDAEELAASEAAAPSHEGPYQQDSYTRHSSYASLDDLDEPTPWGASQQPDDQGVYLPDDVYADANYEDDGYSDEYDDEEDDFLYDDEDAYEDEPVEVNAKVDRTRFDQVWLDVEYEVIGEDDGSESEDDEVSEPLEPAYDEDAYDEPGYDEAVYDEPGYDEPAYDEPTYAEPEPLEPAYNQPTELESAYPEPAYPESTYTEPEYDEPAYTEPVYTEQPSFVSEIKIPQVDQPEAELPEVEAPVTEAAPQDVYEGDLSVGERIKSSATSKRTIIIVSVVVALLIIVYVVGIFNVRGKFLPRTHLGECDLSGMTQQEAEEALTKQTNNYVLTVSASDFATSIDGASVSLDRDEARIAKEAYEQQTPFLWPFALLLGTEPDLDQAITYDNVKFDAALTAAVEQYNQETLPADKVSVALDKVTQAYSLEGSVEGQALDLKEILESAHFSIATMSQAAKPSVEKALRQAQPVDLPQYAHAIENANTVRESTIPILADGKQVVVCDPLLIRSWVTVTNDPAVAVDQAALTKWAEDTLSPIVYKDGEWGEVFLDTDQFVALFSERLKNGDATAFEAITYDELNREGTSRQQAYDETPWNKSLGKYIDIDLSAQFARFFDASGNVMWESAFVSGDELAGHQTVTGTYELYEHLPGQVLVGLDYNNDGKPDYESYVNFWMPFYGGYGLHDATWRDAFGGDLYQYNGSHGCINLPYEKAEELYNMTKIGDKVYVHE